MPATSVWSGSTPRAVAGRCANRIGIVLQATAVDPYLTVHEILTRNAGYYPLPRQVDEVIDLVGLVEKADARVKTLSGGQVRRLDVGLGIIGDPELLFLDEPTTGFDPSARRGAWDLVRNLTGAGATIHAHPRTTWTKHRRLPTGWRSSPVDGSWPRDRRTHSVGATALPR